MKLSAAVMWRNGASKGNGCPGRRTLCKEQQDLAARDMKGPEYLPLPFHFCVRPFDGHQTKNVLIKLRRSPQILYVQSGL